MTKQQGFTLVELMVGLLISLLLILAVAGSLSLYETQRRGMVGGNSAGETSIQAMLALEQEIKMAGLGFLFNGNFLCATLNATNGGTMDNAPFIPVAIGTTANTAFDTITVMYGDAMAAGAPNRVTKSMTILEEPILVNTLMGVEANKPALLSPKNGGGACAIVGITSIIGNEVQHTGGNWNDTSKFSNTLTYPMDSGLIGFNSFEWNTWRVTNERLERVDNFTGTVYRIADNVVAFKVFYGLATTPGSTAIDTWTAPTDPWDALDQTEARSVRAVRIGIVVRNSQPSGREEGACVATLTNKLTLWEEGPEVIPAEPDWQCYRYKIQNMIIPLKNIQYAGLTR